MTTYTDFLDSYGEFVTRAFMVDDETAFRAEATQFITADSVLEEPESIPGVGRLVGFDGWNQWRQTARTWFLKPGIKFTMHPAEYFEKGDTVISHAATDFGPNDAFPEGMHMEIIERYDFVDGKIATLKEFYLDTTAFARYFA